MKIKTVLLLSLMFSLAANAEQSLHNYFTSSDGLEIHYMSVGTGTPVILIHGFTANAEDKWFKTGVADALAKSHWVIAIDARGHGRSDKPHDPNQYGPAMARDVFELMDHLHIDKAHVHGFSMGGGIVTQLIAKDQNRFISASYGGSGVRETDPKWISKVPADEVRDNDREQVARDNLQASEFRDDEALAAVRAYPWKDGERDIDLTAITIPVMAINGSLDRPNEKHHRMQRELKDFTPHVLPERGHLTTVELDSPYTQLLVTFINAHDP